MEDFFTWDTLATMAGCSLATTIITQFIKDVPAFKPIPTQFTSYFVSLLLLYGAVYFTGNLTVAQAAIIPVNAILTSLSSNGAYVLLSQNTSAETPIDTVRKLKENEEVLKVEVVNRENERVPLTETDTLSMKVEKIEAEHIEAAVIEADERR